MITLCLACHAKVTRKLAMDMCWPPLLIQLWREQHPEAHEQLQLDFTVRMMPPKPVPMFAGEQAMEMPDHGKLGKQKAHFQPSHRASTLPQPRLLLVFRPPAQNPGIRPA